MMDQAIDSNEAHVAYCKEYEAHFSYYCTGAPSSISSDVAPFCQKFHQICELSSLPVPFAGYEKETNAFDDKVHSLCSRYALEAKSVCTGKEVGQLKHLCDLYRAYCKPGGEAETKSAAAGVTESSEPYCRNNSDAYTSFCHENPAADEIQFCKQFGIRCPAEKALIDAPLVDEGEQSLPPEITQLPNLKAVCQSLQWMGQMFCKGYETQDMRQYCNIYRVYCLQQKPFPIIDGTIKVNYGDWAVSGIPYYPFNAAGRVAGGDVVNVDFGDWGARVGTANYVTDFWSDGSVVNANWQKGNYGVGSGWGVPVIGLTGFEDKVIKLGGLANPSDYPFLLIGGVPPPAPQQPTVSNATAAADTASGAVVPEGQKPPVLSSQSGLSVGNLNIQEQGYIGLGGTVSNPAFMTMGKAGNIGGFGSSEGFAIGPKGNPFESLKPPMSIYNGIRVPNTINQIPGTPLGYAHLPEVSNGDGTP